MRFLKYLTLAYVLLFCEDRAFDALGAATLSSPYEPVLIINSGDMSQSSLTSPAVNVMDFPCQGIQFIWTGAPTGTFGIQVSNSGSAGTYTALDLSGLQPAANQPAGSAGSWWLDLATNPQYLEVTYTRTSGSGRVNVYLGGKKC